MRMSMIVSINNDADGVYSGMNVKPRDINTHTETVLQKTSFH